MLIRLLYTAVVIVALLAGYRLWTVGRAMDVLGTAPLGIAAGPIDAKVVVVEFFDYRCPACRSMHPRMKEIQERHPEVRFVFRVIPVVTAESTPAARLALAAGKQGKFMQAHDLLMARDEPVTEKDIQGIAAVLGIDAEKLQRDMTSPEVLNTIKNSIRAARRMGVRGTPSFAINGALYASKFIPAPEDIEAVIAAASRPR